MSNDLNNQKTTDGSSFFPTDVKQMGGIEEGFRVYIEDYVYTYLNQYAKSDDASEKVAVLIGKKLNINNETVLIVSGAIQGKNEISQNGVVQLSMESWEYIKDKKNIYFKDLSIVGWVHCRSGFGTNLIGQDEDYHKEHFKENHHILMVMDSDEKQCEIYMYNNTNSMLKKAKGFFIYYDRNAQMQEYMIENRVVKPKTIPIYKEEKDGQKSSVKEDAVIRAKNLLKKKSESIKEKEKSDALFQGVTTVLISSLCMILCFGIVKDRDRIKRLERELSDMKLAYTEMDEKILENYATVFASLDEKSTVDSVSESKEPEPAQETQTALNTAAESSIPEFYVVQKGDNLSYICRKFYGDENMMEKLMEVNSISDPDKIKYGTKIILPRE